ncbi:MAG: HIT family protein [Parachlamydiales bacterium]|jgi:diadenosine tetraphosphate (Ap4A) HIT family hydrolase
MLKNLFLKAVFLIGTLSLFLTATFFFLCLKNSWHPKAKAGYCAFCDKAVLQRQKFYEDDLVLALVTHKPVLPGHVLIIPKRHVPSFDQLTEAEMQKLFLCIKKIHKAAQKKFQAASYLLFQKNGFEFRQTVPHVHFHYLPRKAGDSSVLKFFARMLVVNARKPLAFEKTQVNAAEMKQALEEL